MAKAIKGTIFDVNVKKQEILLKYQGNILKLSGNKEIFSSLLKDLDYSFAEGASDPFIIEESEIEDSHMFFDKDITTLKFTLLIQ